MSARCNEQGVTVVLTTHYLEEAEELCDRIAIINHGKVIANEPTRELLAKAQEKAVVVTFDRDLDSRAGQQQLREYRPARRAAARDHLSQGQGECGRRCLARWRMTGCDRRRVARATPTSRTCSCSLGSEG